MNEKEMKVLVRECVKEYYKEDKRILIDASIIQITSIIYVLYNLIFFGNKIIFSKETYDIILEISKRKYDSKKSEIAIRNANYLIEAIQRDKRGNYQRVDVESYGNTKIESIRNFLIQNSDTIFYLSNLFLYKSLKNDSLSSQLCFLEMGKREINPFRSKYFKFETIGAIKFEEEKMNIYEKEGTLIKVFDKRGIEKEGEIKEVKLTDYVLIRGNKGSKYSFNLYQIVSKHTRNHAIRIIWTDLKIGQKMNKYIDKLPYQYKKMILDNA